MKVTKVCVCCGKSFVTKSRTKKYCCESCQTEAKQAGRKKNNPSNVAASLMDIQHQEYLTFSKAATLMGCSRQYIYKLVSNGKLKASRISNRMAFIRKADIEQMLEKNPYHRILPISTSAQKESANTTTKKLIKEDEANEILEFYSGEEVMKIFKVNKSRLYNSAKRNLIPICRIAGKNYYSKKHINDFFSVTIDTSKISDWIDAKDVQEIFNMSTAALNSYIYRHKIPTKKEFGRKYYSKSHLTELRRTDLVNNICYYTVEQVQQIYGLTSANICRIVNVKHIQKIKVGRKNYLLRTDIERVMAERNKQK